MRSLRGLICFLTVLMSGSRVLLRGFVLAALVVMGRFTVVMGCGFVFARSKVMVLTGFVLGLD